VELKNFKNREIIKDDIILERSGGGPTQPVGRVVFFEREDQFMYSFSNFTSRIRINDKLIIFPKFLFYFLLDFYNQGKTNDIQNRTTGIRNLDFSRYKQIPIPLPPLPEQQKIAAVLSAVQTAKEKTEAVIAAAKAFKKSMMKHLFTYGPVPPEEAENVPLKETKIGLVPEEWDVVRLGEVAEINYGKANTKDKGNIPVVGSGGVYSSTKIPLINYPTIIIGRKGTAGRPWLILEPSYPSDTTFYLSWKKYIEIKYIYNYMVLNPLSGEHAKTTLPSLQKTDLVNYLFPLPPLPVQQKIASILSAIDAKIEAEENKKQALEELFKTLLDNLMTAKIRVYKVSVNSTPLSIKHHKGEEMLSI